MAGQKIQAVCAAERRSIKNSFEQESSPCSSETATEPVSPVLGQAADWSGFGQHTPDTSPECVGVALSHHKQAPVRLGGREDVGLAISSNASPSTEEITGSLNTYNCLQISIQSDPKERIAESSDLCSHHSIDSEPSDEVSTIVYSDQKEKDSSVSVVSLYNSFVSFFNLDRKRNSRADDARVQGTIRLIKSLPTIRRTRTTNPTRRLTPRHYRELLTKIEDNKEFQDKLRFEYSHSTQQFKIRMTTRIHEGIVGRFNESFIEWRGQLKESGDSRISDAAKALRPYGNQHIKLLVSKGATDAKSPDGGIKHDKCIFKCRKPALVFEVEFSNKSKEELRDKAEAYILDSNGEIRTVVAVYMRDIYAAERKNERRLRKMYREGTVDESGLYSYSTDENNITGEASILVWRATVQKDNSLTTGRVQEWKFRDIDGNAIQPMSLRIPLEDCVCKVDMDLTKTFKAPPLEISSTALCEAIQLDLEIYREERADVIREDVNKEKRKKKDEEEENQRREERRLRATGIRMREDVGVLGRVFIKGQRSFSARIMVESRKQVQQNLPCET